MKRWTVGAVVASLTFAGAAAGGAVAKPAAPAKKHAQVHHAAPDKTIKP
jgi:hypothetical protein